MIVSWPGTIKAVRLNVNKDYEGTPVELYNQEEDKAKAKNVVEKYSGIAVEMLELLKASHSS